MAQRTAYNVLDGQVGYINPLGYPSHDSDRSYHSSMPILPLPSVTTTMLGTMVIVSSLLTCTNGSALTNALDSGLGRSGSTSNLSRWLTSFPSMAIPWPR